MLKDVDAFDNNIMVTCELGFIENQYLFGAFKVIPGDVKVSVTTNKMLMLLPEEPMRPRLADPRLGVSFMEVSQVENDRKGLKSTFYTKRWRVEPVDEAAHRRGEMVEVKKPIVFYMDTLMPKEWQPYIKEGIEAWKEAFEKIGFKDVVRVMDFPKDDPNFDPENIKYSCIRYAPSTVANAMGPSWIDPRSGEIINASVTVFHNIVQLVQYWRFLQTAPADEEVRDVVLREDLLGDCIAYVLSHEVGHTLSLMHNMAGSSSIPVESLRDPKFTQEFGTTYSIMDYARNNYIAQPGDKERGVRLTPPELGAYDYYAIAWLYSPIFEAKTAEEEIPILDKWISEKSGDVKYRYGKQQFRRRFDPSSVEEDLGEDPVKASEYGRRNLQ